MQYKITRNTRQQNDPEDLYILHKNIRRKVITTYIRHTAMNCIFTTFSQRRVVGWWGIQYYNMDALYMEIGYMLYTPAPNLLINYKSKDEVNYRNCFIVVKENH